MRGELRQIDPWVLYRRRLAYRALELVIDQHGLRDASTRLNPDDPSQCLTDDQGRIRFYLDNGALVNAFRSGAEVAWVTYLDDTTLRVQVPKVANILRVAHRKAFRASDIGIVAGPDGVEVDVELDVSDMAETDGEKLLDAPQRPPAPRSRSSAGPVRVRRAFGGRS